MRHLAFGLGLPFSLVKSASKLACEKLDITGCIERFLGLLNSIRNACEWNHFDRDFRIVKLIEKL